MTEIALPIRWRIIAINCLWFTGLILFFVAVHYLAPESNASSLAAAISARVLLLLLATLAWQLGRNKAIIEDEEMVLRAGFYSQRWPLEVISRPWRDYHLNEFHRSNGVHVYGYSAGYYSRAGVKRHFVLAMGGSQVCCLEIQGYHRCVWTVKRTLAFYRSHVEIAITCPPAEPPDNTVWFRTQHFEQACFLYPFELKEGL